MLGHSLFGKIIINDGLMVFNLITYTAWINFWSSYNRRSWRPLHPIF